MQHRRLYSTISLIAVFSTVSVEAQKGGSESLNKEHVKMAAVRPEIMRPKSVPEPEWLLRDQEGREIEATLLSANGDSVKIQRVGDEKEFTIPISSFDSETKHRIRNWIDRDPAAVDFSLDISASKELMGKDEFDMAGRSLKTSKWSYKVVIANETRNDLSDATVEYRIIYDDHINFSRTSVVPGDGKAQQDGQAIDIPEMSFNDEIEFNTPILETHTYEYRSTRSRDYSKDEIKGIWIRIVRRGEIIGEFKTNEAAMNSYSWDNEDEVEIQITNRFRDSFEELEP